MGVCGERKTADKKSHENKMHALSSKPNTEIQRQRRDWVMSWEQKRTNLVGKFEI